MRGRISRLVGDQQLGMIAGDDGVDYLFESLSLFRTTFASLQVWSAGDLRPEYGYEAGVGCPDCDPRGRSVTALVAADLRVLVGAELRVLVRADLRVLVGADLRALAGADLRALAG